MEKQGIMNEYIEMFFHSIHANHNKNIIASRKTSAGNGLCSPSNAFSMVFCWCAPHADYGTTEIPQTHRAALWLNIQPLLSNRSGWSGAQIQGKPTTDTRAQCPLGCAEQAICNRWSFYVAGSAYLRTILGFGPDLGVMSLKLCNKDCAHMRSV